MDNTFDDLNLNENILRGVYAYGFEKPSLIQSKSIPIIMNGKDIIAQAQSGTGKTGAFTIGMLNNLDETIKKTQYIINSTFVFFTKRIFHNIIIVFKI